MTIPVSAPPAQTDTATPSLDLDAAARFIARLLPKLAPGEAWAVESVRRPAKGGRGPAPVIVALLDHTATPDALLDAIRQASRSPRVDLYLATNPLDVAALRAAQEVDPSKRGGKDQTSRTVVIVADLDHTGGLHAAPKHGRHPSPEEVAGLLAGLPAPTFIVESGGGWHVWWVLDVPVSVEEGTPLRRAVRNRLAHNAERLGLHVDLGVTPDVARILRIPGTVSWKVTGDPRPVRILAESDDVSAAAILAADPDGEREDVEESESLPAAASAATEPRSSTASVWDYLAPDSGSGRWFADALAAWERENPWDAVMARNGWTRTGPGEWQRPGAAETSDPKSAALRPSGRLRVYSAAAPLVDMDSSGQTPTYDRLDVECAGRGLAPNGTPDVRARTDVLREWAQARGLLTSSERPRSDGAGPASDHTGAAAGEPYGGQDGQDGADDPEPSSWEPVDLGPLLSGTYVPEVPTLMARSDGVRLLYPARIHSMHGESESGKSLLAQWVAVETMRAGLRVLYVDWESDAPAVVARLLRMGATPDLLAEWLDYVRPDSSPHAAANLSAYRALLGRSYGLAVLDGVTDGYGMATGASSADNDALAQWLRSFPRRIARETGAAVLMVDHVTKDADSRGRFAIGGQAKMAALDGAAYVLDVSEPCGLGLRGVVVLRIAKDRPGSVRPECGPWRKSDRTQEAARVVIDSTGPTTVVTVEAPSAALDSEPDTFRPTAVMEKVSRALEESGRTLSNSDLRTMVGSSPRYVLAALSWLDAEGFIRRESGPRGAVLNVLARPYRQTEDRRSDKYAAAQGTGNRWGDSTDVPEPVEAPVPVPRSKDPGTGEQVRVPLSTRSREQVGTGEGTGEQVGEQEPSGALDLGSDDVGSGHHDGPRHACAGAACQVIGCEWEPDDAAGWPDDSEPWAGEEVAP